jgi:2-hydroxychromene-2-carboxylate isomerase
VTAVLCFDLGSPYAWLAAERAGSVLGEDPELEPVFLGGIFKQRGFGSWADTPERAENVAEVERRAAAYGLPPVRWPPGWPPNTLAAMRAATWAKREGRGREFALAAFRTAFVDGRSLAEPAALEAAAAAAGLAADDVPGAVRDPAVKEALRAATDAAWARGVRGVPTLVAGGELYYGDDRLEEAAAALRNRS